MKSPKSKLSRDMARALRQAPDVDSAEFRAEARRQSLAIAQSPGEAEDQAFIDAVSIIDED
jgi:hypothetical protein